MRAASFQWGLLPTLPSVGFVWDFSAKGNTPWRFAFKKPQYLE
jgi:hypothetical protein